MELNSNDRQPQSSLWKRLQRFAMPRVSRIWLLALAVLTIGGMLRFWHLGTAVYWGDEVYSSLRIFGHTTAQLHSTIAQTPLISHDALQAFQQIRPTEGLNRTLESLAIEDAHIAPLYFVLARIWGSIFGDSVTAMRSLAALFGVLLIPASYYLAMDLFNLPQDDRPELNRRTAHAIASWMMILVASSPLHFLMAREARGYSLWMLTTVLSSIFLLRALKRSHWDRWVLFAIALMLNFYSNFLALITFFGYLVYVTIIYWRNRATLRQFGVASSLSLLGFFPWLSVFLTRAMVDNRDAEGVIGHASLQLAVRNWFELLRRLWIDFDTNPGTSKFWAIGLGLVVIASCGLIIQGSRQIHQAHGFRVGLFLTLLILPLPLCFFDRSLQGLLPSRYLLPSYIGLQLIAAYALGQPQRQPHQRTIGLVATAMIISVGLFSCQQSAIASNWWNKYFSNCNTQAAAIVNATPQPLIISDGTGGKHFDHALSNLLSLNRLVKAETQFQVSLETSLDSPPIAPQFPHRFLFAPSNAFRDRLAAAYPGKLHPLLNHQNPYRGETVCLWRLDP
jgi:uncharacterized membrane protein